MDRTNEIDSMTSVSEQASAWWVLLNEGDPTAAERRAFTEWVKRSPERVGAFLQAAQLAQTLSSQSTKWPETSVEELIRAAQESRQEVPRIGAGQSDLRATESSSSPSRSRRPFLIGGLAAAATVVIAGVGTSLYFHSRPERIETAIGEQRSVVLSDGSLVTLNTASAVEVRFTRDHRGVTLLAGEALFNVAHDAQRPFDVIAGATTARAVGTRFNVDRRENATTVTVVEGRVAVFDASNDRNENAGERVLLNAGQKVTRTPERPGAAVAPANVTTAIAWTERKLIFENRPLGEVAAEFNRYNRRTIEIRGAKLRSEEVTGVFRADDPESFLAFLARLPEVSIESDGSHFVVRSQATEDLPPK